jgi:hypothetical protein
MESQEQEEKNKGGRPSFYKTPEQIQQAIEGYFTKIKGEINLNEDGDGIPYKTDPEPPTITGLALHLGFESRQSFYDYEARGEFSYAIKRARLRIENSYEIALRFNNPTGAIFALKNFGWTDKQEVEQKTTITDDRIDESKLTDEELRTLAELQRKSRPSEA